MSPLSPLSPSTSSTSTDPKLDITSEAEKREAVAKIILYVDYFTAVYFTIEYVVRFACAPQKAKFFVQPMNLIDLFAILPYFINIILDHIISEFHIIGKAGKVIRLVRVTKVLRVFKLVRHFAGLQSLFYTIRRASRELGLLLTLVFVMVLTFSSLVYFAEKEDSTNQWSFMDSFWWGLLTITTVGNGAYCSLESNTDSPSATFSTFSPSFRRCGETGHPCRKVRGFDVRGPGHLHPDPPHPHRGQQLLRLLPQPPLAQRGGHPEEGPPAQAGAVRAAQGARRRTYRTQRRDCLKRKGRRRAHWVLFALLELEILKGFLAR